MTIDPEPVTIEPEPASPTAVSISDRHPAESDAFAALLAHCADRLAQQAQSIAQRWDEQARSVELRETDVHGVADRVATGRALILALGRALTSDAGTSEDAIAIGLAYGADAFSEGISLHHMLKGLDLLEAMVLFTIENDLAAHDGGGYGLAHGVQLARRFRRFSSLAAIAAAKGYTQAVSDEMRDRFRHLRHDLRNPLGTIKSVLSLMDDQSVPTDARAHPRFRVMASRNARSLDELIAARLSDAEALLPVFAHQRVSLRRIACSVRRELRAEADARGATVVIDADAQRVRVDAAGVELLLHELLHAALQEAQAAEELRVGFVSMGNTRVAIRVERGATGAPISDPEILSRLATLAASMGAWLRQTDAVVLELTVHHEEGDEQIAVPPHADAVAVAATPRLRDGQSRHDIGSSSERDDGQPRLE